MNFLIYSFAHFYQENVVLGSTRADLTAFGSSKNAARHSGTVIGRLARAGSSACRIGDFNARSKPPPHLHPVGLSSFEFPPSPPPPAPGYWPSEPESRSVPSSRRQSKHRARITRRQT